MNVLKKAGIFTIGVAFSIGAQYVGLYLTSLFNLPDPALLFLYSSIGVLISIASAAYFLRKGERTVAAGIIVGVPFWLAYFWIVMAITGTWL
jgi:hypothetical protein